MPRGNAQARSSGCCSSTRLGETSLLLSVQRGGRGQRSNHERLNCLAPRSGSVLLPHAAVVLQARVSPLPSLGLPWPAGQLAPSLARAIVRHLPAKVVLAQRQLHPADHHQQHQSKNHRDNLVPSPSTNQTNLSSAASAHNHRHHVRHSRSPDDAYPPHAGSCSCMLPASCPLRKAAVPHRISLHDLKISH